MFSPSTNSDSDSKQEDSPVIPLAGPVNFPEHSEDKYPLLSTDEDLHKTVHTINLKLNKQRAKRSSSVKVGDMDDIEVTSPDEDNARSKKDKKSRGKKTPSRRKSRLSMSMDDADEVSSGSPRKEVEASPSPRKRGPLSEAKDIAESPNKRRRRSRSACPVSDVAVLPLPMRFDPPENYTQRQPSSAVYKEDLEDSDVELWLCRIPENIDVDLLNNKEMNFNDSTTIATHTKGDYNTITELSVEKIKPEDSPFTVLVPSRKDGHLHPVKKSFTGHMTVKESPVLQPYVIPSPRPKVHKELPPGLKQRYIPYGSAAPLVTSQDEDSVEERTEGKKKKKKKKKVRESLEDHVKKDATDSITESGTEVIEDSEKRKKKKKKKKTEHE